MVNASSTASSTARPKWRVRLALAAAVAVAIAIAMNAAAQPALVRIVFTGQSMIRSDLRAAKPEAIDAIKRWLKGDVIFTNLEAAIALPGETVREGRGFLAPPGALDALAAMGVNLLALSNNHAFDLKENGIRNTLAKADRRGIAHAGTGRTLAEAASPAYLHAANITVALVASASGLVPAGGRAAPDRAGVNELRVKAGDRQNNATEDLPGAPPNAPDAEDAGRILQNIRDARPRADLVVVYQHNHVFGDRSFSTIFTEGMSERLAPNRWLVQWTHDEIDAGADIVVLHGAPLLHGVEIYRGRPILYDLGNFIYNLPPTLTYIDEPMAWESVVASVEFDPHAHAMRSITFRPIVMNPIGDGDPNVHDPYAVNEFLVTRGLPAPAAGARGRYILQRLADFSKPFGTSVVVNGDVATIALSDR